MRDLITRKLADTREPADPAQGKVPDIPGRPQRSTAFFEGRLTAAAVLVPLVERPAGLSVLLTRRAENLKRHPGQISFPGGIIEDADEGPLAAALRETEEEIGLNERYVTVAGYLDTYATGTGYAVTPIVGFVEPGFSLRLDEVEVSEAFEAPLDYLIDPGNWRIGTRQFGKREYHFYEVRYGEYLIWGATASMLVNLHKKIYS